MFHFPSFCHTFLVAKRSSAVRSDVLDLSADDTDLYLSEIDERPAKRVSSVVVKSSNFSTDSIVHTPKQDLPQEKRRSKPINRKHNERPRDFSVKAKPRVSNRTRGSNRILGNTTNKRFRSPSRSPVTNRLVFPPTNLQVCLANNTTTTTRTFETRGTQTERIGPCKCARSVQSRNQRRRLQNKKNKQIINSLPQQAA